MFQVGDYIWHNDYGRGQVAKISGAVTEVMFDNEEYNDIVTTELPILSREEDEEGNVYTNVDPTTGKPLFIHPITEEETTDNTAPIDGYTIHWNEDPMEPGSEPEGYNLGPAPTGLIREYTQFKFPPTKPEDEGPYYTVLKAGPHFTLIRDKDTGEPKMVAVENLANYSLQDNKTGEKYKIQIKLNEIPAFYVPRKMTTESIKGLLEEGDELF